MQPVRRIVTGHDENGKAVVVMDGAAPNVKVRKAGFVSTLLWITEESPANIASNEDRADREIGTAPPPNGSILRVVDFPPETEGGHELKQADVLAEMGLPQEGHAGASRHPFMHRTKSIDYAIVLQGEIDMLLDDSEVHLSAGDILVQQGTNHAWVNRGTQTCRIAFVLIDAEAPPAFGLAGDSALQSAQA